MEVGTTLSGDGNPQPKPTVIQDAYEYRFDGIREKYQPVHSDNEADGLFERACRSAIDAGGQMLFELPGALFGDGNARVAALRHGSDEALCFVIQRQYAPHIRIVSGEEAPVEIAEFVSAYAGVLQLIASDQGITGRLPH